MPQSSQTGPFASSSKRLISLDALRGFDMFFIVGGAVLIEKAILGLNLSMFDWLIPQLHHPKWGESITAYDFIFPLFLFMVGVSLFYSVSSAQKKGIEKKSIYMHAFRRMLILCLLGIVYKNRPLHFDWENIRYVSVLGRIGITGFVTTLIICNYKFRAQIIWMFSLLIVYWLAVMFIPVPGFGAGVMTMEGNLVGFLDRMFLPGRLINGIYDENGFTAHIPATSLVLIGALTGQILKNEKYSEIRKIQLLSMGGGLLVLLGLLWGLHFPIVKYLWSSSFILVTGGASVLLLVVFYLLIDFWGFEKCAFPLVVIGLNSLTIYLASALIDFKFSADYLLNGFYQLASDENLHALIQVIGVLALEWVMLYFLYRKKLFVKI
ncbi:MAG: DUF5009 domain-containing protein [Verrucomicrobia bacterium]|nr:DUF5009 domain-containing protein [Verrucomicrobiota bacterium]